MLRHVPPFAKRRPSNADAIDVAGVALTPDEIAALPPRLAELVHRRFSEAGTPMAEDPEESERPNESGQGHAPQS